MHVMCEAQPLCILHIYNKYTLIYIYILHTRILHVWIRPYVYVYVYDLYFEKRILFNRYTYKIDLQALFGSRHAAGYINL